MLNFIRKIFPNKKSNSEHIIIASIDTKLVKTEAQQFEEDVSNLCNPESRFIDKYRAFKRIGNNPQVLECLISIRHQLLTAKPEPNTFAGGHGTGTLGEKFIVEITIQIGLQDEANLIVFLSEIKRRTQNYPMSPNAPSYFKEYLEERKAFVAEIDKALAQCEI